MKIRVELDIFSGRPNPTWTLDEGATKKVAELLNGQGFPKVEPPSPAILGYRGFLLLVEDDRPGAAKTLRVFGGGHDDRSRQGASYAIPALEEVLLESAAREGHAELLAHFRPREF